MPLVRLAGGGRGVERPRSLTARLRCSIAANPRLHEQKRRGRVLRSALGPKAGPVPHRDYRGNECNSSTSSVSPRTWKG